MTRTIRPHVAVATLVAAAFAGFCAQTASASAITSFSGNTHPQNNPDGATINFAVYNHTGGVVGDTFGTGLAGFDALFTAGSLSGAFSTSSSYLYLYQDVANDPNGSGVFENTVGVTSSNVTSWGSFAGTSFSVDVLGTAAAPGNPSPASTGATPVILGLQAGLVTPGISDGSSSVKAQFLATFLSNGHKSVLWGFTSDAGPLIGNTAMLDNVGAGGQAATAGAAAVPTPAASAAGLALLAIPAVSRLRRRRQA